MTAQSQPYIVFNEESAVLRSELNIILASIQDRLDRIEGIRGEAELRGKLKMIEAPIDEARAVFITAATTLDLRNSKGNLVDVTGTTEIRQILLDDGAERTIRFNNPVNLIHNASKFILPGLADLTARINDHAIVRGYPDNVTRMISFLRGPVGPFGQLQAIYAASVNTTVLISGKHENIGAYVYGGGGGGGGANGAAGESAAGAGGSGGGYAHTLITFNNLRDAGVIADSTSFDLTIGSGGAGGVGNAAGASGGTTTLSVTVGAITTTFLQATGGSGGGASVSGVGPGVIATPGAPGIGSSPSGLGLITGTRGGYGDSAIRMAAIRAKGGFGGSSAMDGSITAGQTASANGIAGINQGSGGGGALSQDGGGSFNGGTGQAGRIILFGYA